MKKQIKAKSRGLGKNSQSESGSEDEDRAKIQKLKKSKKWIFNMFKLPQSMGTAVYIIQIYFILLECSDIYNRRIKYRS